ncbi:hypothetical protein Rmet_6405 [Cupriavidus metallidurans CH34]|uniref:Uncharacterized protein n=1 Tax=Cupriavidus metallidurans (strain ATCC 43123 / DSM 2839 / NBRC 102507 / CH34) TaxID=266264 RepID=D3DXK3_CUPMC|nr:hypothetical protein Rmet_6405 [Cupriavidus metallidurans CH34]
MAGGGVPFVRINVEIRGTRAIRFYLKLPTPVLAGSGSKGLSQPPGPSERHPCFIQRGEFKHKPLPDASQRSVASVMHHSIGIDMLRCTITADASRLAGLVAGFGSVARAVVAVP